MINLSKICTTLVTGLFMMVVSSAAYSVVHGPISVGGVPLASTSLTITFPDGTTHGAKTDANGNIQDDDGGAFIFPSDGSYVATWEGGSQTLSVAGPMVSPLLAGGAVVFAGVVLNNSGDGGSSSSSSSSTSTVNETLSASCGSASDPASHLSVNGGPISFLGMGSMFNLSGTQPGSVFFTVDINGNPAAASGTINGVVSVSGSLDSGLSDSLLAGASYSAMSNGNNLSGSLTWTVDVTPNGQSIPVSFSCTTP